MAKDYVKYLLIAENTKLSNHIKYIVWKKLRMDKVFEEINQCEKSGRKVDKWGKNRSTEERRVYHFKFHICISEALKHSREIS